MNDRYMVISPDTLEAMRRAGHAAKLEARIEKLEAALRKIASLGFWDGDRAAGIARQALEKSNEDA